METVPRVRFGEVTALSLPTTRIKTKRKGPGHQKPQQMSILLDIDGRSRQSLDFAG
jgi:hypothetical protein